MGSTSFAPRTLVRVGRCRGSPLLVVPSGRRRTRAHDSISSVDSSVRLERGTSAGCNFHDDERWTTWFKGPDPRVARVFLATAVNTAVVSDICSHPQPVNRFQTLVPTTLSLCNRVGATDSVAHGTDPPNGNVSEQTRTTVRHRLVEHLRHECEGEPGRGGQHSRLSLSESRRRRITWLVTSTTPALDSIRSTVYL